MLSQQGTLNGFSHSIVFDELKGDSMKRILVVDSGSLLEEGVVILLASKVGLDVVSTAIESEDRLIGCFDSLCPEVVFISKEAHVNLIRLFDLLDRIPKFSQLQVLVISADSNMIDVYENGQAYRLHSQNLFDFLQGVEIKG